MARRAMAVTCRSSRGSAGQQVGVGVDVTGKRGKERRKSRSSEVTRTRQDGWRTSAGAGVAKTRTN